LRRHAAHRERVAPVAGFDQQQGIRTQKRGRHRDPRAIGKAEFLPRTELLDATENVIPAPDVEAGRVLAQLVEYFVHLERGEHGFDQCRRLDGPLRHTQRILRHHENIVPQPGFEMAFHLRQVKVRPAVGGEQGLRVVEEIQREVEDRRGHGHAIDFDMALDEVPAARPHQQCRRRVVQLV